MSKNPDFTTIPFAGVKKNEKSWDQDAVDRLVWQTMEQIDVKPIYTQEDLKGMEHLGYVAGIAPFLRGPYPTMYVSQPWTVRQYAGFSTAEESNAFYRRNL